MKKNNKKLKLFSLIFLILFCSYFQTVAYSAINSTMTIKGDAYARVDADVRITNFKLSSSSSNSTSSYEEFSVNTIASKFNLLDSSSSIVFDVEVTNYGSSDVGILQLIGTVPTGLSYEIINYNLKDKICDDTGKCNQMAVKTFQIKFMGTPGEYEVNLELDFRTYHKVSYTDVTNNNYPTEVIDGGNLNITFTENIKKVSVLSDGTEIEHYDQINSGQTITIENISNDIEIKRNKELVARLVSGKIDEVGSEVCIKDECFYIISNDGSTVSMIAKYNLYVGGDYASSASIYTSYGDEATGKQDSAMIGFTGILGFDQIYMGVNVFSNTNYWSSTTSSYPSYVYDSNSTLYSYVENYKTYLSTLGATPSEARLITYEELTSLGCIEDDYSCSGAPSWVYSTSYWTGSAYSSNNIFVVMSVDSFASDEYSWDSTYGCRPVIEMSVDDIKIPVKPVMVSGEYDTVGSEVAIGDEHFYVISSTDDTVTMLAKYNLHVGYVATPEVSDVNYNVNNYNVSPLIMTSNDAYVMPLAPDGPITEEDQTLETIPIENPSGIQDASAKGITGDSASYIGVDEFTGLHYWTYNVSGSNRVLYEKYGTTYPAYVYDTNSNLYSYIENYKIFLQNYGIAVSDARLISHEELLALGCIQASCMSAPSWVYSTSYWTGSATSVSTVYYVESGGLFLSSLASKNDSYGVRPVITISKSEF